ncbi:hypothetical protein [Massilia sp. H6]|uniref:hypothetical protein n=1 Tax=Massilia sp. H6 TaxID=2970464 RepID=UPI002166FB2C|nr:hypothetical protein [Massilia sp. H6]UVW29947.1 hypothetical protein NRS07_07470 [Massilia sp. H6]
MPKFLLLLLLGCAACTSQAHDPDRKTAPAAPITSPPQAAPPASAQDTLSRIRAHIGKAACSDNSQCRTLAVGARACGGPETYLAYSAADGQDAALRALAERYQKERQAQNAASGMISTCVFMPDPGAVCTAGTCQTGNAAVSQAR